MPEPGSSETYQTPPRSGVDLEKKFKKRTGRNFDEPTPIAQLIRNKNTFKSWLAGLPGKKSSR